MDYDYMSEDDWMPIATVPDEIKLECEVILLYKPDEERVGEYIVTGYWSNLYNDWVGSGERKLGYDSNIGYPQGHPTHWMRLPPPPKN